MELSKNEEQILDVFFNQPTGKFHIREMARISRLNPNIVLSAAKILEKKGLIIREKKRHIVELSANRTLYFKNLKRIYNLKSIYDSGLIEILVNILSPEAVCVMGSFS